MTSPQTTVAAGGEDWESAESPQTLAERLGLDLHTAENQALTPCKFILFYRHGRLSLQHLAVDAPGAICVDFDDAVIAYRQNHPVQPEALLKASGVRQGRGQRVLDATAGLGQDAFIFASAGCEVLLMERSPILHALLADGLRRAAMSANPKVVESARRMTLVQGDSTELAVAAIGQKPEIVYLDPMFPERRKSAKVKKNMFMLQQLLEDDVPSANLLHKALLIAGRRVVVKRPRHAEYLEERKPSHQLLGKTSRFDVYVPLIADGL